MVCTSSVNNNGPFRENYIADKASGVVRQAKFRMPHTLGFLHFFNLGTFSVFLSENTQNGKSADSDVYYVENKTEKVVFKHPWQASMRSHFFLPGYDPNALVEAVHENYDVSKVTVVSKRLMTIGEIYLHLMLGLNEDFDDDLLMDGLEALGYINL